MSKTTSTLFFCAFALHGLFVACGQGKVTDPQSGDWADSLDIRKMLYQDNILDSLTAVLPEKIANQVLSSSSETGQSSSLVSSAGVSSISAPSSSSVPRSSSGTLSSSVSISSSSAISSSAPSSSSTASSVDCSAYPDWTATIYNWVSVREFVKYQGRAYSHQNWVNDTTPDANSAWTDEGACL